MTFVDDKVVNKTQTGVDLGDAVITAETYEQIEMEMKYKDVVGIISGEGSLISESDVNGNKAEIYTWFAEDRIANANILFLDGVVQSKAHVVLPGQYSCPLYMSRFLIKTKRTSL